MRQPQYLQSRVHLSTKEASVVFSSSLLWRCVALLLLVLPVTLFSPQTAQAAGEPTLSIASPTVNLMNGSSFAVAVSFDNGTHDIAAMSFSLNFDESCLTFDGVTDSNLDGIPDAVTGLPSSNGYVSTVSYDDEDTGG